MTPLLEPIAALVRTTNMVLLTSLEDLKEPDTKIRVRNGEGPSLTWEVGHLLDFRCQFLELLGVTRENPYAALFPVMGATNGEDYPTMAELSKDFQNVASELEMAMGAASGDSLRRVAEQGPHGEKTVLDSIAFLVWHEAYHVGAVGSIRKALGYPGPAEMVKAKAAG